MLTYVLFVVLFIVGFISTITTTFLKVPINNKFLAWFHKPPSTTNIVEAPCSDGGITKPEKVLKESSGSSSSSSRRAQFKGELRSVFATFDKNNDGYITKQELKESLKNIGITINDKDVKEMVEKVDSNGDGLIDLDEFCELFDSIMGVQGVPTQEEEENGREDGDGDGDGEGEGYLREAFDVFDGDRDGEITVEELGLVLSSLGFKEGKLMEDCKEMIRKFDVDGDGKINFGEFKRMMKAGSGILPTI